MAKHLLSRAAHDRLRAEHEDLTTRGRIEVAQKIEVARAHGALHYPFFLDGVAADPKLNQKDGIHPNEKGTQVIVRNILPHVEALIAQIKAGKTR